jgi:hypothetical protein
MTNGMVSGLRQIQNEPMIQNTAPILLAAGHCWTHSRHWSDYGTDLLALKNFFFLLEYSRKRNSAND